MRKTTVLYNTLMHE